ncbi:[citrate (pro-3S)-lyase] ligase [Hydrogenoanaerobacterium sp.]|uniref:[citrate (pro-3S)-lyase] ligase n=1 Tax=Hydrogenoanaerobacterium sp. TaxID=2953763 RepID=UPI002896D5EB|nr:[citrate (pro-3S)-lyase] ligase [Hydrogenoanaerobacterium sp.]
MEIVCATPLVGKKLLQTQLFVCEMGLDWDVNVQATVNLMENNKIVATGSRYKNVLKCIAVSREREGEGHTAAIVTELVKNALEYGYLHLFLFTKPDNLEKFSGLGFCPVAQTKEVMLMENRKDGIKRFVNELKCPTKKGVVGSIVANCNPFTNGHRFLVETAARNCDLVHLFILSEDRSYFPAAVRMELVQKGVEDLTNVIVHPTSNYLISSATFPDYFMKDKVQAKKINCELDLTIFAEQFAKPLGITRRYVGSEPNDPVTAAYNEQMHRTLPPYGIEVVEIPRCEKNGGAVSASVVRALLAKERFEDIRPLVPPTTYAYLERMSLHGTE